MLTLHTYNYMSSSKEHLKKLTTFLQLLSDNEWKGFMLYAQSPLFKISPNAQKLASYLDVFYPSFLHKNIDEEKITQKYPSLASKAAQAKAGSELLKAAENYLVFINRHTDEFENKLALLRVYDQKGMFDKFSKLYNELTEIEVQMGIQDCFALDRLYKLEVTWFASFQSKIDRTSKNDIARLVRIGEKAYAFQQLIFYCEIWMRHLNFGTPIEVPQIEWIQNTLKDYDTPQNLYVYVYLRLYNCFSLDFETALLSFNEIKGAFLGANTEQPLPKSLAETANLLTTLCQMWYNQGKVEMGNEYLWLSDVKLKNNHLFSSGYLELAVYRNYIIMCLSTHQPKDRLLTFMTTYSKFLPPNITPPQLSFCDALYHYHIKDLEKALVLINDAMIKEDPIFNAIVRRWEFAILFEAQDYADVEFLSYKLDAFEKYILREKAEMQMLKKIFNHFISNARKLLKANSKIEKQQLKSFIENEEIFPAKSWMIEMLEK